MHWHTSCRVKHEDVVTNAPLQKSPGCGVNAGSQATYTCMQERCPSRGFCLTFSDLQYIVAEILSLSKHKLALMLRFQLGALRLLLMAVIQPAVSLTCGIVWSRR